MTPYYADKSVQMYLGDCREVLPALGVTADCIVADPPYGENLLGVEDSLNPAAEKLERLRKFAEECRELASNGLPAYAAIATDILAIIDGKEGQ